jgi:maleylacetate reductase
VQAPRRGINLNRDEIAPPRFNRDLPGTRLLFAPGAVLELPSQLASLGLRRAFVVSTGGRAAALVPPQELLGDVLVEVYSAAQEHVPVAVAAKALKRFRANRADVCIAIGGGTAIGLGKAIAKETGAPLVAVPTTYSGSEMTSIWGQTDEIGKRTGRDPTVKPRLVIYDVTLTFALPADVSAASGMNAMAHAVEAMYAANATGETRDMAEEAARLLADSLPQVVAKGTDLKARTAALSGAHLAGRALDEASMGLHHRICHVLGGTFKLPHARTHAVMLPHVVAFNAPAAPAAMQRLAAALGKPDIAVALSTLNGAIGISYALSDLGFYKRDIDRVADEVIATPYPNPRPVMRDDVRTILSAAL